MRDEVLCLIEAFKHPEKLRNVECDKKAEDYIRYYFDEDFVKAEIMGRFKNPRDPEKPMENR